MAVKVTSDNLLDLLTTSNSALKQQNVNKTPQTTGGLVSATSKKSGVEVPESVVPLSHRNRTPFDWLDNAKTTVSPNALDSNAGYESKRLTDTISNFGMGGKTVDMSGKEYTSAPKAAAVGALDAVEGMVKSPASMMAGYYSSKDTHLSKREAEGGKTLTEQVEERSKQYQKENKVANEKKAEEWAKKAESISLYGKDTSVRNFMNKTKAEMQEIKDETGVKFTLADMAYTMGQMAPSIALGKAGGAIGSRVALAGMSQAELLAAASNAASVAANTMSLGAQVGSTIGSIGSMYSQIYGNSFDEARAQGADAKTAADYAQAHALVEAGTELLGGGIPGMNEGVATKIFSNLAGRTAEKFGGAAAGKLLPKVATTIGNLLSSPGGEMFLDIAGEGVEEMISEVYDPWIDQTTIDPNRPDATFDDVMMAGLTGVMVSAMMQGGVKIFKTAAENRQAYRYNEQTKKIEKPGDTIAESSQAAEQKQEAAIADRVSGFDAATRYADEVGKPATSETVEADSVTEPKSSVEAAKNGALSQTEAVDLTNRRSAKVFMNSLMEGAFAGKNAFREGGEMFDRYKDVITPEMLDNYSADLSSVPRFLDESRDYTWDELDTYIKEVAVPLLTTSTIERLSYENMRGRVRVHTDNTDRMMNSKEYADWVAKKVFGADSYANLGDAERKKIREEFKNKVSSARQEVSDYIEDMNKMFASRGLKMELDEHLPKDMAMGYSAKDNVIYVNPDTVFSVDAARFFMGHELVHYALNTLDDANRKRFRDYTRAAAKAIGVDLNDWTSRYKKTETYKYTANEETYARFYSDLMGSPDMLAELNAANPEVLQDIRDYMKAVSKQRQLPNRAARAAEAAAIAQVDAAIKGVGKKTEAKRNRPLMASVPEVVQEAAAVKGEGSDTVEAAHQAAIESAPSETAAEAKAKVTPAKEHSEFSYYHGFYLDGLSKKHRSILDNDFAANEVWPESRATGFDQSDYEAYRKGLPKVERQFLDDVDSIRKRHIDDTEDYALAEELYKYFPKRYSQYTPVESDLVDLVAKEKALSEKSESKKPDLSEIFPMRSEGQIEMPAEVRSSGFQRIPSSDGKQYTFQQALAGEGKSGREGRARRAEKAMAESLDTDIVVPVPGIPGVSVKVVDTVHNDGTHTRTIRVIPDDSHAKAKRGEYYLLNDTEVKQFKQLGFKGKNGIYDHDFTPEFWNALRTADPEAVRAKSGVEDDREVFREYQSSVQGIRDSGAVFCFMPSAKGEQIKLYFRRTDGSRTYGATLPKETFKESYQFKYDKYNEHGPGFYAPFSDKLADELGLPATTKSMRDKENRIYSQKRKLFSDGWRVTCSGEGFEGFEIGYNPLNNTLYLYPEGSETAVFSAPYSGDIINKALGMSDVLGDTFMARSDAKKRVDNIIEGLHDRNVQRSFSGITAEEEARGNRAAEELRETKPLDEEEISRITAQEARMRNRRDTVTVEFRDTDETVQLPISTLKQMTTLSETKKGGLRLAWNGQMLDELYWGEFTPEEVRLDPRTGEHRRLTGHEIASRIIDNATGKVVWDATQYDETKQRPGEDIKIDHAWFKDAFARADNLDAEQDAAARAAKRKEEATAESFRNKKAAEEAREANEEADELEELRRSYEEGSGMEAYADERVAESDELASDYYEKLASDVSKAERRGWKNNDVFFAENQSEKKSRAEQLWDDRSEEARLTLSEIEQIKAAEKAGARDVDLASMSAEDLVNTYRGANGRSRLIAQLTEQRDTARREQRFDDYAVLDKRLNEVKELNKRLTTQEEYVTSRMPSAEDMSSIVQSREKRIALQTEARAALEKADELDAKRADYEKKAEDAYKGWIVATEDEKSAIRKKVKGLTAKAEKLTSQIEEQRKKAESLTAQADKIKKVLDQYDALHKSETATQRNLTAEEKETLSHRIKEVSEQEEYAPVQAEADATNYDSAYSVELEDDMLDVHPMEQRLRDSDGDTLSPLQEEFYKSKPGSMNAQGQVQKYYADYMDSDNTEYGNGILRLYTDPTASEYQVEEVYAATERPIFYDDTVGDSTLTAEVINDAMAMLGLAANGETFSLDDNANLLDVLKNIAESSETAEVSSAQIMDELLLQLGADSIILPDGMILFDERYIKSVTDKTPAKDDGLRGLILDDDYIGELRRQWSVAGEKYGTIEGTDIPRAVSDDGMRVTTTTRQLTQNENTNVDGTPLSEANRELILKGMADYAPMTDKKALKLVGDWLRKGNKGTVNNPDEMTAEDFQRKYEQWMDSGEVNSKVSVLKGGQLMSEMANFARENPDRVDDNMMRAWEALVGKVALGASRTGQMLQAYAALKKLTPQGRLGYIRGMVEQLQNELNNTKGALRGKLKNVKLTIDQKYIDQINAAKTQEELDAAEDAICKHIAEQIPATLESRVNAYRYLCMLGSARTHVRNVFSNAMMAAAKGVAREGSGLMQDVFVRKGEKSTSFFKRPTAAMKEFAKADALRQQEALQYGGKQGFEDRLRNYRKNFGDSLAGKFFEKLSRLNGNALEWEDWKFLQLEYRISLARYMAANGLTPEHFNSNTKKALEDLNRAREYAMNQAWDATYRQANIVADALNQIEKDSTVGSVIIAGLIPFKRTPANILIQGVRYSPIGLLDGMAKVGKALAGGEVTGAEAADRLAQGLTGSGITLLGFMLGSMGMMKASGSDSDREEYYDQMIGNQRYSIRLGGKSYTIDWLTPISMPLMAGVELAENARAEAEVDEEEDFNIKFNRLVSAISTMADPVTNLSLLQGINEALSAYQNNQIGSLATNAAQSYALQFVPTASGQLLRTLDPTRRTTYAPKDSEYPLGKFGEQFVNKFKNKSVLANVPRLVGAAGDLLNGEGWNFSIGNAEYVDQWGRTEQGDENPVLRAFNQFIAPWYSRDFNSTAVDDKLATIFTKNGEQPSVLPATPQNRFTINNKSYYLSGDEFETVKKTIGNLSYRGLEDAFAYKYFDYLDPDAQTYVIEKVYSYARAAAKADYANKHGLELSSTDASTVRKVTEAERNGIGVGQYYVIKQVTKDLKSAEKKERLALFGIPEELWELF